MQDEGCMGNTAYALEHDATAQRRLPPDDFGEDKLVAGRT
jgi:hypothetical protein